MTGVQTCALPISVIFLLILAVTGFSGEAWSIILGYHRIIENPVKAPDITVRAFEEQMQFIKNNYNIITLEHLVKCIVEKIPLDANSVVVTLDDGDRSSYQKAYPVLKKLNIPATLFLYTDFLGKGGLTWEEAVEMSKNGITLGSHTVAHVNLTEKKPGETQEKYLERIRFELVESKKRIENKIGQPVLYLNYPYGRHDGTVEKEAAAAGYAAAVGTSWDRNYVSSAGLFNLKRRLIPGKYKFTDFVDIFKNRSIDKSLEIEDEEYR